MLRALAIVLGRRGYGVDCAPHGAAALGMLRRQVPDLILLDARMPVMDGYAACQAIRANSAWTAAAILMMTSGNRAVDHARCRGLGATASIAKPFGMTQLIAVAGSILGTSAGAG
jgi:DNA-binding response OmpR family regulator